MRYILIAALLLTFIPLPPAQAAIFQTVSPNYYNFSNKDLTTLEKQIFGRSFSRENPETRIKRLETNLLGAVQSGNLNNRFQTLLTTAHHYNENTALNTFSTQQNSGFGNSIRKVFNTITNSGYMTGYTPPISPYGYNYPYGFPQQNTYYNNWNNTWNNPWSNYGNGFDSYADISRIELTRNNFTTNALEEKVYLDKTVLETDYELNNYDVIRIQRLSDMNPVVFLEGAIATEVDTELDASRKIPFQFIPGDDYAYFVRRNKSLFTSSSDLSNAYIIREGEKIYIDLTPMIYDSNNYTKIEMKPNDTLIIPFKQFFISVAGAVLKPGRYPYIPDRTWDYYIGLAGGFDMTKNYHDAIKIVDINGKRLSKNDVITPECTITAKTNSGLYYFNQYAPIVTTTLTAIVSAITITTYIESKK